MHDTPRASYDNDQSGIRPTFYNVMVQVMLDIFRKGVMGETLDAHISKVFHTNYGTERLPRNS